MATGHGAMTRVKSALGLVVSLVTGWSINYIACCGQATPSMLRYGTHNMSPIFNQLAFKTLLLGDG